MTNQNKNIKSITIFSSSHKDQNIMLKLRYFNIL